MYVPPLYAEDPERIARNVRDWPFATVVTTGALGLFATHVPLVLVGERRLVGHVARSNPHHADFDGPVLVVFHGPHAAIRSDWYGEPARHVPTWSYVAVHATGTIRTIADPIEALDLAVSAFHAPDRVPTGEPDRDAFVAKLARAIVAFEIDVVRWEAKAKLSQNRDDADRTRVRDALRARGHGDDHAVADEMERRELVRR